MRPKHRNTTSRRKVKGKTLYLLSAVFSLAMSAELASAQCPGQNGAVVSSGSTYVNSVTIQATNSQGDDTNADACGVYVNSSVNQPFSFTNQQTGIISATAEIGDVTNPSSFNYADSYGVYIEADVSRFTNSGSISASATSGNAEGDDSYSEAEAYGTYFWYDVSSFTNSGSISASATSGNATGSDSSTYAEAYGVYVDETTANFTNSGSISASATSGNATGSDSYTYAEAYGVYFSDTVGTFTNSGSISASVVAGSATGSNATVEVGGLAAVVFGNGVNNFENTATGLISASVKAGKNADIGDVAGVLIDNATSGNIVNEGIISVKVDAQEANSVGNVAGIYITNSTVVLTNIGYIYLSNNAPNVDIRTLRIENSTVTMVDAFSIVFGQPGVDINMRPIYVDSSSTLDLNDAKLIANAGINLLFNQPYFVIENDGTVNGTWSDLVRGFANNEIQVDWYGNDRGEDSAVIFKFAPTKSSPVIPMVISPTAGTISNMLMERAFSSAVGRIYNIGKHTRETLHASTSSPVLRGNKEKERNSIFVFPFYSYVNAKDLGFNSKGMGAGFGFELNPSDNLKFGLYGAMAKTDIDYKTMGALDGEQRIYGIGFYVDYIKKPFYITFINFGYSADNEYTGLTGPNYEISEKADFWSKGIDSKLLGGYIISVDDWVFIPNAGIGFTYTDIDSYTTKTTVPSWSRRVKSDTVSYATGYAGLLASKRWNLRGAKVYLTGLFRLEQALGDNDVAVTQSIPALGSGEVKVKKDIANTTVRGRVELEYRMRENYGIGIMGETAINSDYKSYGGRLTLKWLF